MEEKRMSPLELNALLAEVLSGDAIIDYVKRAEIDPSIGERIRAAAQEGIDQYNQSQKEPASA